MRVLVDNYGDVRIFKDRSLFGVPRYIVEWDDGSTQLFNAVWYNIKTVREIIECRLTNS